MRTGMLRKDVFRYIAHHFYVPEVDLFASRLSHRLSLLCVATSRPLCFSGGCLSTGLEPVEEFYLPTSFATTSNFQKVRSDKATTLLVAPDWPGQPWYAQIHLMLTGPPYLRPEEKSLLSLPFDQFKFSSSSKYLTSGEI